MEVGEGLFLFLFRPLPPKTMKEKAETKHSYLFQPPRRGDTLDQQREILGAATLPRGHGYGERRDVDEGGAAAVVSPRC